MKRYLLGFCLALFVSVVAPIESMADQPHEAIIAVAGAPVDMILNKFDQKMKENIDHATASADYLRENAHYSASMLLNQVHYILKDNQDTLFENLSEGRQKLLVNIEEILDRTDEVVGEIKDLEELLVLDLHDLLNRFPDILISEEFLLMRFEGFSQIFQQGGHYRFLLRGNAFDLENRIGIRVGKYEIANEDLEETGNRHDIAFSIPAADFKDLFKDRETTRVPVKIEVFRETKKWFFLKSEETILSYSSNILLLPKLPVAEYKLTEYYKTAGWANAKIISRSMICPAAGNNNKDGTRIRICIEGPPGTRMDREYAYRSWERRCDPPCDITPHVDDFGSWGEWEFPADNIACIAYRNRIHDQARNIFVQGSYSTWTKVQHDRELRFTTETGGCLPYGDHGVKLPDDYTGFDLEMKFFYGASKTITHSSTSADMPAGVSFKVDENPKRLLLTISKSK